MFRKRLAFWSFTALAAAALAGALAGPIARNAAQTRFAAQALADAQLRQALIESEIARLRLLPLALADDRDLAAVVAGTPGAPAIMNAKLERLAHDAGAAVIYVIRQDGMTLAASNWRSPASFLGKDYGFRPYFKEAAARGASQQFALGSVSGRPGLYLARRAAGGSVVVVKLEFDRLETQWRAAGGITFVTDQRGVILVSSRADWRFAATAPLTPAARHSEEQTGGVARLGPMPFRRIDGDRLVLPTPQGDHLLATTAPDPQGWRINLALPLRPVETAVTMARLVSALVALTLIGIAAILAERRRRRTERTRQLEEAVAERTAALRLEMAERVAAEDRAEQLRETLRQANRLATLGQITAGVAHETAQPVAAIRNLALSSRLLLERGALDETRANLQSIDRLAERIGAVTAQLRGFARKGQGRIGPVALAEIIDGASLMLKERLSHVTFDCPSLPADLRVVGGRVRLEQILVNLMRNGLEALDGVPDPRLALTVQAQEETVAITIADNGPGIAPDLAERLFTPFATTRPAGLGLGLVIARDIAEEFGGTLQHLPTAKGAAFTLTLVRAS